MRKSRTTSWRAYRPEAALAPCAAPALRCRVLGLDPGSRRTGYGLIDINGDTCVHIAHGCIDVSGLEFPARLRRIFEAVQALIEAHSPDEVAVERVFMARNPDSALKLGQARGAALAAIPMQTAMFEYATREVKLAMTGHGGAEKRQVAHMIGSVLSLPLPIPEDASDALAVAFCHSNARRIARLLATRVASAP